MSTIRFTPGARTAWHAHALGQTLYVIEGLGYVQVEGEEIVQLRPGDLVYAPPNEWHWHGASPTHFMTHLSMISGVPVDHEAETAWGPKVSDDEYQSGQQ